MNLHLTLLAVSFPYLTARSSPVRVLLCDSACSECLLRRCFHELCADKAVLVTL